eukprot:jgi/Ulvmu1/7083/UM033_0144.1
MSGKSYICCCGFQSTRATEFLQHLRQEGSSGTGLHRMLVSHEEPRGFSIDITNEFTPSVNPLWSPSPDRKRHADKAYDSDSPLTVPPQSQQPIGGHAAPPGASDLSLLQQSNQNQARSVHWDSDPSTGRSTPEQPSEPRYNTRQWANQQEVLPEAAVATGIRHKHARDKSRGESQPASKRRVTTDASNDDPALHPHTSFGTSARALPGAGASHLAQGSVGSRRETAQRGAAPHDAAGDTGVPHTERPVRTTDSAESPTHHRHIRRQALHSSASPQATTSSSPDCTRSPHQLGSLPHSPAAAGSSGLPVSQPAVCATAVRRAEERALGVVPHPQDPASCPHALSRRPVCAAQPAAHPLDDFWPEALDAGALVAWVERLVGWRNSAHSSHALLLALYGMYVMKRWTEQVSFAPMSVVSTVALAAVVRHGMAATLPTVRAQARMFQQQAQGQKEGEDRSARAIAEACLQAAAAIACHAYDTIEGTLSKRQQGQRVIGWAEGEKADGPSAGRAQHPVQGPRLEASEVAKAMLVLVHRATACETASGSCMTAAVLWALLVLSELGVVSQWSVAMVACGACFAAMPLLAAFGDVLEELAASVLAAMPLLWVPGVRRKWVTSVCVGSMVLWCVPGRAVLRITVGVWAGLSCLLWLMQSAASRTVRYHQE